jgi:2-polyprenyl-6-hydroxyphenyl methylase/3-demethylubiquinone-9 3-methyltransferase
MRGRSRRNDLRQYDELTGEWWRSHGAFAALHWLARARGELMPSPSRPEAELLDLGCSGGLLAPYVSLSTCWRGPFRVGA